MLASLMQADQPLVSVCISFLNAEETILDAVRSVFAQTYENWELILVDDGSDDRSLYLVQELSDSRVKVYSDGQHRGTAARLNELNSLAQGKYVTRMDGDDLMHPNRLSRQVASLESDPDVDIVGSSIISVTADLQPLGVRNTSPPESALPTVLSSGFLIQGTCTARREWFLANPYDDSFPRAQDLDLWCRVANTVSFSHDSMPLLYYREPRTLPLRKYVRSTRANRRIVRRYLPPLSLARTRLLCTSYLKTLVFGLATVLGLQRALVDRRSSVLTAIAAREATDTIQRMLSTHLDRTP